MFSFKYCKIFNNSFFIELLRWLLLEKAHTFNEIFGSTKDTHWEKAPSNETPTIPKIMNINIRVVDTSNQLDMLKHELRVTSCELRVESLKARVEIQKCEFKSTSSSLRVASSALRVTSSSPRVTSLNARVTSSNRRITSCNP